MSTQIPATLAPAGFSVDQRRQLLALRARYNQQAGDLFMAAELERLRFLRWLSRTGRLVA